MLPYIFTLLILGSIYPQISPAKDSVSIYFAGDLMQHGPQIRFATNKEDGTFDYTECFEAVKEQISSADIAVGNLEVPLGGKPYSGYPQFSAPDEYALAIKDAGFDLLITANNHSLDRRKQGVNRTIDMLDSLNILHVGTYKNDSLKSESYPLLVEKNNIRIAFLAYTYGTNGIQIQPPCKVNLIDREEIKKDVEKAKSMSPDVIIACMHWGIEYQHYPQQTEKDLAKWMLEQGVDHIIGSHPHVIQPIEVITSPNDSTKRSVVAYSLGNFISNQSKATTNRDNTDGGASVTLKLSKKYGKTELTDCYYSFNWVSRPQVSGNSNYKVYPADYDTLKLNNSERTLVEKFLKSARKLYSNSNKGINEHIFIKKSAK